MHHSTTQPRIAAITHPQVTIINKSLFLIALASFGIFSILVGVVGLASVLIPFLSTSILSLAGTTAINAVFDLFVGAMILASARAFARGNFMAIWLYAASLVIDSFYKLMMGYPLNFIFVGFGLILIWQLLKFRNQWESL